MIHERYVPPCPPRSTLEGLGVRYFGFRVATPMEKIPRPTISMRKIVEVTKIDVSIVRVGAPAKSIRAGKSEI